MSTSTSAGIGGLREAVRGTVLTPDDERYEERRLIELATYDDERPAAVVEVADARDVAAVVRYAAEHGLELAVRSGGHGGGGHGSVPGGVVVDVRGLDRIEVDPAARTATAGGGVTAGRFTQAVGEHGLATGFGDTGSVGVAGLTLGGGVGLLSRRLGLTIDSLLGVELVTADGAVRRVDADHDPDLFWAVRGGGGNVGVVTRLTYRLHEVRSVVGGLLVLPADGAVLRAVVDLAAAAPRDLTVILTAMPAPPMPFLPPEVHGRPIAMVTLAHAGPAEEGHRLADAFRAVAPPLADLVREMPYPELLQGEGGGPGMRPIAALDTSYADDLPAAALERAVAWLTEQPRLMRIVQVRVLGGAIADVPAEATAYAHRDAAHLLYVAAMTDTVAGARALQPEVTALATELSGGRRGAYANFLGRVGPDRVRDAYPDATAGRLAAIKRRYDPGNLFHRNHNVPPA